MIKLIIFFRQPANPDQFEDRFANHVQLISKMPNVKRTVVNRSIGAPRGEPAYFLIHEVFFTDLAAANFALNAPEGRMAGADLMSFAREITTLLFTEVWGEDPEIIAESVAEPAVVASPELEAELAAEQSLAFAPVATTTTATMPATLSTAAAMTVTTIAGAVANAAPESVGTLSPVAAPTAEPAPETSRASELDALPTDPEIFGSYPTPSPDLVGVAVPEMMTDEATEAALLDGAVIDGVVVSDPLNVDDEVESLDALGVDSDIEPDLDPDADTDATEPTPPKTPTGNTYNSDGTPKN